MSQTWYVIKRSAGHCEILLSDQITKETQEIAERWGPFTSQNEAIAHRVGLIRSAKCQPT